MMTFFACPKRFSGHIGVIQRNAIKSWTLLVPKPEIIALGDEDGVAEVCDEFGLIHVRDIERNELGTPLVSSIFKIAQEKARQPVLCYINSDIILMSDFMPSVQLVAGKMPQFLIMAQRRDLDVRVSWDFSHPEWETKLRAAVAREGRVHMPNGIDFFCFPRGMYETVPPFAIGRFVWDNWLVWHAWSRGVALVDATDGVHIVHQNHEYASRTMQRLDPAGGGPGPSPAGPVRIIDGQTVAIGKEIQDNMALVSADHNLNIWAADLRIDHAGRLRRRSTKLSFPYVKYRLKVVVPLRFPILRGLIHCLEIIARAVGKGRK
jgi:hypothetical protein